MARRSYETLARDLAKEKGISVQVEVDNGRDFSVEIWAFDAHQNFDDAHTNIPSMEGYGLKSPAAVWKQVYEDLQQYEPCQEDCGCYA